MAGKGSRVRPLNVSKQQFEDNWDRIFSKKKVEKTEQQPSTMSIVNNVNIHDVWNFAKQNAHLHTEGYDKDSFAYVAWWIDQYAQSVK